MTEKIIKNNKNNEATPGDKKGSFSFRRLLASIRIWDAYYFLVAVCYVLTVFTAAARPGVFASALLILTGLCAIFSQMRKYRITHADTTAKVAIKELIKELNICDSFVIAYIGYNIISVVWILISGMPLYVYSGELVTFILPAVFYIVGRMSDTANGFYSGYLWGLLVICVVGLIFYITAPQIYLDYLYDWSYISLADASTMRVRMNSVCGSTILGSMSAAGMLAGAALFWGGKNKKLGVIGFITGFVFAVLSNQRSAMVVAILIAVYINVLVFFTFKMFKKKYFYMECGAIGVLFVALLFVAPSVIMKIYYRLVSLPQAIGERSEQWVAAVNMMFSSWIGNGLGANGHRALGIDGVKVVADGGLVKMFCELGVIGFAIFAYLMILLYKRGMKKFGECFAEIGIISIFLLQSVGSNVLSFQLVSPIFWYAIGRIIYVTKASDSCDE